MRRKVEPPTWFSRWRDYPGSILGHVAWGSVAGVVVLLPYLSPAGAPGVEMMLAIGCAAFAGLWFLTGILYQFGSALRKFAETGETDTVGLDCADYGVGLLLGFAVTLCTTLAVRGWP